MSSHITLVVGASRGIGRELVTQLASSPSNQVVATVRKPVDFASEHNNIKVVTLDQTDSASVSAAASEIPEIDTLILNGAIGDDERLVTISEERLQTYLDTNVLGLFRVVKAFLPALEARKTRKIVFISSTSGSITRQAEGTFGFSGPYSVSKAACNMLAVQFHVELHEEKGFIVTPIHPGWVDTDMGNPGGAKHEEGKGPIPKEKSAKGILNVVGGLKKQDSAKFYVYDGSTLPW